MSCFNKILRIFCLLWLFLFCAGQSTASEGSSPFRDKWAVVIGIGKFIKPELDLNCAENDARAFSKYLVEKAGFAEDHVKLLINQNATRRRVLATLGTAWLSRVAGPDDLVVIYISSHGSPAELDVEGVNYLLASDSDPDDLYSSGIDMQALARMFKAKIHAERIVIFLDTCYSGAGGGTKGLVRKANVDASRISMSSGQAVIASSLPNQVSFESADKKNSVFTKYLLEGLSIRGRETSLAEAFAYLKDKVETTALKERGELQTPVMKASSEQANIAIAAPAQDPQVALSEELEEKVPASALSLPKTNTAGRRVESPESTPAQAASPGIPSSKRIAILPFEEGSDTDSNSVEFEGLAARLEDMVRLSIAGTLSDSLLSPYQLGAALAKTKMSGVWTPESRQVLGSACRAKYLVRVILRELRFGQDGKCVAKVGVTVASGANGDYLWSGGHKPEGLSCAGDSQQKLAYAKNTVLPALARYLARAIIAATSRE